MDAHRKAVFSIGSTREWQDLCRGIDCRFQRHVPLQPGVHEGRSPQESLSEQRRVDRRRHTLPPYVFLTLCSPPSISLSAPVFLFFNFFALLFFFSSSLPLPPPLSFLLPFFQTSRRGRRDLSSVDPTHKRTN